ncbi:hypothetical protein JTE90_025786 [Oedothorax gibbosus]|uniref:Uncharacterized protein n=1 Tax=Oedothorax gibbosus TaxID=931172 RepID=A0AAV6V317_9ARAC|nr:hypothetical protein JTE90_025786 [Oedothorax gibbosus]
MNTHLKYSAMKIFNSVLLLCALAGFLTDALAEDCKSSFNEVMCHTFCMLNQLAVGTCRVESGKDKCRCYGKRSLPDDSKIARARDDYELALSSPIDMDEVVRGFFDSQLSVAKEEEETGYL